MHQMGWPGAVRPGAVRPERERRNKIERSVQGKCQYQGSVLCECSAVWHFWEINGDRNGYPLLLTWAVEGAVGGEVEEEGEAEAEADACEPGG